MDILSLTAVELAKAIREGKTTAVVGIKFSNILEEQVVRVPSVHILSLMAKGTPAKGPVNSPASIFFCTSAACCNALSRSTVT